MAPELGISIALGAKEPMDRIVSIVQRADALGVSAAWVLDSQTLYKDAYMVLAVLAREAAQIKVGPGVTNLITRHETVVANAMATLETTAPGRVLVGTGTGDSSVRPLGIRPLRLAEFRYAVERLRSLLRGDTVQIGTKEVRLSVVPDRPPPIYVAATQPRMLRTAGEVADGVIILGPSNPDTLRLQMEWIDAGARDAGREPGDVRRDLWVGMSVGEAQTALDDVRSFAATQARVLADWDDLPPALESFRQDFARAADSYDYRGHLRMKAGHAAAVSNEFVRAVAIAGTHEDCLARLRQLADAGLDRISVTLLPGGRERRLEQLVALWEELAPPYRAPSGALEGG
jgi:5,10-methylenetetrahydromethanopterin reductase